MKLYKKEGNVIQILSFPNESAEKGDYLMVEDADVAKALIGKRPIKTVVTGIRPGEKLHEILVSEEEAHRSIRRGDYFVILPILPELRLPDDGAPTLTSEYSSADDVMTAAATKDLLDRSGLLSIDEIRLEGELLR